ncbi:hypothetical protein [Roseobacter ponti]|uniref:hypothetical protein n=1 Tax=Roseobacter ponti TaxID=1891787 RepID=UPI001FE84B25|nr:hypothetical protein [Roseobacter ponti]
MSLQPQFPGFFAPEQGALPLHAPQPGSDKQIRYAEALAKRAGIPLPKGLLADRHRLSDWIDAHKPQKPSGRFADYPSSRQVAFAERISRVRRRAIPDACFRDKALMSGWIDANRPPRAGLSHPVAARRRGPSSDA